MIRKQLLTQIMRYLLVGGGLNLAWFLVYLVLTAQGLSPVATVTVCYPLAVYTGYRFHGVHTFKLQRDAFQRGAGIRYITLYFSGYLINALLLCTLHERLGIPHQQVQTLAVLTCAVFLYLGMRLFVFRRSLSTKTGRKLTALKG